MNLARIIRASRRAGIVSIWLICSAPVIAQVDSTVFIDDSVDVRTHPVNDEEGRAYFLKKTDSLSLSVRGISAEARKKMQEDDDFWYANSDLKKSRQQVLEERERGRQAGKDNKGPAIREKRQQTPISYQPWFQTLLWIIIIVGFVVFLAIYLANSNVGLFRKKARRTSEEASDPEM